MMPIECSGCFSFSSTFFFFFCILVFLNASNRLLKQSFNGWRVSKVSDLQDSQLPSAASLGDYP